jgi:biotin operon repressor
MSHRTSPGIPVQSPKGADCGHVREPFDAAFRVINERRDIGPAAKLVHAHLVTLHRTGRDATQTEIGEALGMSRHQVWRAIGELMAAGLVQTIRYGLGRPNGYILLGLDRETLDGKSGRASASRPAGGQQAGRAGTPARAFIPEKKTAKNAGYTGGERDYFETRTGRLPMRP